jgi:hypothetical protein
VLFNVNSHDQGNTKNTVDTNTVDTLRNKEYVGGMLVTIRNTVDAICSMESSEAIQKQIHTYFPAHKNIWKIVNSFLSNHPHVFSDLIRVIHKRRINNDSRWWHIPDEYIDEIQQIFLFRDRTENIWKNIKSIIDYILKNQDFIAFCVWQQSILDIGSHDFSLIKENKRHSAIKRLVTTGLITNIAWCTSDNINTLYFLPTKTRILHFLYEIYGTKVTDLEWCQNIDDLSKELNKLFEIGKWNDRKRAWKVIQAFHAWWDILDIESRYAKTKNSLEKIPKRLKEINISIDPESIKMEVEKWVEVYKGTWNYKWYPVIVSWRAKTPKSILKKLWATEEYIRSSAVRDELGLSFVYDSTIPVDIKKEIMLLSNMLMPENGYILKNKWELNNPTLYTSLLNEAKKKPLFESSKAWLDPKIQNASQSGFTKIWWQTMGCEMQYSSTEAMKYKKTEDPVYKLKDTMDSIMRWANQASPKEIFDAITREIPTLEDIEKLKEAIIFIGDANYLQDNKCDSYSDILLYLLNKWDHVHAFTAPLDTEMAGDIAFFTTKTHIGTFKNKWSSKFTLCTPNNSPEQWEKLIQYMRSLE